MFFSILFSFFYFIEFKCQLIDQTESIVKSKHKDDPWRLQMVYNMRWNDSKNHLAFKREKATEQSHKGAMQLGVNPPAGMEDAEMSFFYGIGKPNMLIEFKEPENGVPYCMIGIVDDKLLTTDLLDFSTYKHCAFERKKIYQYEGPMKSPNPRLYGFCPLDINLHWKITNGIYNRPSNTPHCIYDFHKAATLNNEYEFFRYCAKGYFYQGMNYFDYAKSKIAKFRKDWLLYLAEGRLQCRLSGNVETDKRLLAKGYTVELIQYNYPRRFFEEMILCPKLSGTLSSYHDKRKDGKFFFAAMVGAAQLDGEFEWSYKEPMGFWNEATYKTEYERMNLDERACYLQYHKQLLREDGRYGLIIKVTHYCSDRGMRISTSFDVSIGPEQVPDGIHEDTGLVIDLTDGHLRRTTCQTICAIGWPNNNCEVTEKQLLTDHYKKEGENCTQTFECPTGFHCFGKKKDVCERKHAKPKAGDCKYVRENAVCARGSNAQAKPDCLKGETECHTDQFCMFDYKEKKHECHKLRFKEEGEPCCCRNKFGVESSECFPGLYCTSDLDEPGVCEKT